MIISNKAMDLYDEIKNKTINDFYARPELSSEGRITNGWELISDEWKCGWLDLCGIDTEKLSDFEKLSAWFEALRVMPDNALKQVFREEREAILGANGLGADPLSFWRSTAEMLADKNDAVADLLRDNNVKLMNLSEYSNGVANCSNNSVVDINREMTALIKNGASLDFHTWSERLISLLKEKKPPYVLAADIKDMGFVRGDHYHAEQVYGRIKSGGSISGEERSRLFFWILADICARLDGDCVLHLSIGENYAAAHLLISYLIMRGICPRIKIGVSYNTSRLGRELCELCRLDSKRVSLELVVGIEDSPTVLSGRFAELLSFYPAERLDFGGVVTDSKLYFAAHRYARKIICETLVGMADVNTARAILSKLFN